MKYRNIPHTDLYPSVLCLGALPFGVSQSEKSAFALMDRFFEGGGNFLDTALVYGEWLPNGKGLSEKTVGKWVQAHRNRVDLVIGTKGAHPRLATMHIPRLSRDEIVSDLDESLRNLKTDYVDLYWLHRDDPNRPVGEILQTLNDQVRAGKIRCFGCSNWRVGRIREAQAYAVAHGLRGFAGNQLLWSLAVPNPAALWDPTMAAMDEETRQYHLESGMAAMAYTSQAKGFFSKLNASSISELSESLRESYENEETLKRMSRLKKLSQELALPVGVLSLAYLVSQPFPTFPIAACSTMEQLTENLQAGDVELVSSIVDYLERGE